MNLLRKVLKWMSETDFSNMINMLLGDKPRVLDTPAPPQQPRQPVNYTGQDLTSLIKQFEGFSPVPYTPVAHDVLTIGYGTTKNVKPGMTIDQKTAEKFLLEDIKEAEQAVNRLVNIDLTPNQRTALTSLIYNIGSGNFAKSRARKALNSGDIDTFVKEAFDPELGFVKASGVTYPGLVNRRQKERYIFLGNA